MSQNFSVEHNIVYSKKYICFNCHKIDFSLKINRKLRALLVRSIIGPAVFALETALEERSEWRICGRRKKRNLSSSFMLGVGRLGRLSHIPHERRRRSSRSLSKQLHILPCPEFSHVLSSCRNIARSALCRFVLMDHGECARFTRRISIKKMSP